MLQTVPRACSFMLRLDILEKEGYKSVQRRICRQKLNYFHSPFFSCNMREFIVKTFIQKQIVITQWMSKNMCMQYFLKDQSYHKYSHITKHLTIWQTDISVECLLKWMQHDVLLKSLLCLILYVVLYDVVGIFQINWLVCPLPNKFMPLHDTCLFVPCPWKCIFCILTENLCTKLFNLLHFKSIITECVNF